MSIFSRTGLVLDEVFLQHKCLWDEKYPECPERLDCILKRIKELNLIDRCIKIPVREAKLEEVLKVHTEEHYNKLKAIQNEKDPLILEQLSSKYDSVYFHPSTFKLSLLAAGSVIDLVNAILLNKVSNGFACIRPPGHHAIKNEFNGYCFLNNSAIATHHALSFGLDRILIVDWDIHHGQGIQYCFYDDPRVLYFSIHKYLYGSFWPELNDSNYNFIGSEKAKGFNINVPLNEEGLNDLDYSAIFHNILLPIAYQWNPQLIIISAGYDAALGCPEGKMNLTPAVYAYFCHLLKALAGGKVCVVLEGGYCLASLAEGAALTLKTLIGDPCPLLNSWIVEKWDEKEFMINAQSNFTSNPQSLTETKSSDLDDFTSKFASLNLENKNFVEKYDEEKNKEFEKDNENHLSLERDKKSTSISDKIFKTSNNLHRVKLHKSVIETTLNVLWAQRNYWSCLRIQKEFDSLNSSPEDPLEIQHKPVLEYRGRMSLIEKPSSYPTKGFHEVISATAKARFEEILTCLKDITDLSVPPVRTCIVFVKSSAHKDYSNPERLSRIVSIFNEISISGLLSLCKILTPRIASIEELSLVHELPYIRKIANLSKSTQSQIKSIAASYNSIFMTKNSFQCAKEAVGSLLQVVDEVLSGSCLNGFAIIRPPGHHAKPKEAAGFCIFNNVSIAAKYALDRYNLSRILILDYDVHHGDGTQEIFEGDDRVLFISLHRYEHGGFYPYSMHSDYKTKKNIINIPWNNGCLGDGEYMMAMLTIVCPVVREFNPELVLISSGFDAAIKDPLGGYNLSPEIYGHFVHLMMSYASGKLVVALEGGYNLRSLSKASYHVLSVLLGLPPIPLKELKFNSEFFNILRDIMKYHSSNFNSLLFTASLPKQPCE